MYYSLSETKSFGAESESYVIDLALNSSKTQLAVNLSNECIDIIDSKTLQTLITIKDLEQLNPVLKYSQQNTNHLIVCTVDSVKIFDLRHKSHKTCKEFRIFGESEPNLKNDLNCNQLTCFDVNCDSNYLCAGTEISEKDKNSYLLFWDIRRPELVLGSYSESHTNDITDVSFHPIRRNVFATGSCDELVNVFDLNEPEEEEALMATLNVEAAIDRIHWTRSMQNKMVCLTRDQSVQLWDIEEAVPDFSTSALGTDSTFDYVIGFLPNVESVCVANKTHSIALFDIKSTLCANGIEFKESVANGHNKMVRTVASNADNSVIYSGGEDSLICVWNRLEVNNSYVNRSQTNGKTRIRRSEKNRSNPY